MTDGSVAESSVTDGLVIESSVIDRVVLVMAKQPIAGLSKTRLTPGLSQEAAADLSRCFVVDAVHAMTELAGRLPGTVVKVAGTPTESESYFRTATPNAGFIAQQGITLGDRLDSVMSSTLGDGISLVIAVNGDSPTLPSTVVEDAFERLGSDDVDVVLGPAEDGGYYLIGWKRPHPRMVKDVTMSTETVLVDTLAIADELGLHVALTEPWYDVDRPADLERVRRDLDRGRYCGPATTAFFSQRPWLGRPDARSGTE